jgi:predicted Zn-dependent protease with MMP-like domain
MDKANFEQLVSTAVAALPDEIAAKLENIDIVVQDWPSRDQLRQVGLRHGQSLLGLYEGVPLTKRGRRYGLVPPDKITIFQKPIEAKCGQVSTEVVAEIARVVRHEIGHHFGVSDTRLEEIENRAGHRPHLM